MEFNIDPKRLALQDASGMQIVQIIRELASKISTQPIIDVSGMLKGDGLGGVSAAIPGKDYLKDLPNDFKQALLQIASKVAYIDNHGQMYYSALFMALYQVASISVIYTQSGTVYDTDSLDILKNDLVVTATFADGTTGVIPNDACTLSGTLTVGTSVIAVSCQEATATFSVTVTEARLPAAYREVPYISAGASYGQVGPYIDTGYVPNTQSVIQVDFRFASINADTGNKIGRLSGIGGGIGNENSRFAFGVDFSSGNTSKWYCGIGNQNTWNGSNDTNRHTFVLDAASKKFRVDSTEYNVAYTALTNSNTFLIFARLALSTNSVIYIGDRCNGELYGVVIMEGNTKIKELVPCYSKDNSMFGLYDIVNNVFLSNGGSGAFASGESA